MRSYFLLFLVLLSELGVFASVSDLNIDLNFSSDANSVTFPVKGAAPTPMSLFESSVYMCFHPLYILLIRLGVLSFGKSVRLRFF